MKKYLTPTAKLAATLGLVLSTSVVSAETPAKPSVLQACMPSFNTENSLSIPENCSYTISNYLSSYLQPKSTPSAFQQRAYATRLGASAEQDNACAINNTARNKLSLAITKKLVASGQSSYEVEQMINDSIAEQYPC